MDTEAPAFQKAGYGDKSKAPKFPFGDLGADHYNSGRVKGNQQWDGRGERKSYSHF